MYPLVLLYCSPLQSNPYSIQLFLPYVHCALCSLALFSLHFLLTTVHSSSLIALFISVFPPLSTLMCLVFGNLIKSCPKTLHLVQIGAFHFHTLSQVSSDHFFFSTHLNKNICRTPSFPCLLGSIQECTNTTCTMAQSRGQGVTTIYS